MRTWKEKIVGVLSGRNHSGKWFSHKKIIECLENEGHKPPKSISCFLVELIRTGHVQRANKPDQMRAKYRPQKEYIYRWTGKPYNRTNHIEKLVNNNMYMDDQDAQQMQLGLKIYLENKKLPKWFRNMMK